MCATVDIFLTYLMQFLGSCSQSISQRNRSHASQPMGGVLISPLSRAKVVTQSAEATRSVTECIPAEERSN